MTIRGDKQHTRIVILTIALMGLSAISFFQHNPMLFIWQEKLQFAPGTSTFTLSIAFFLSVLAAVLFTRNSSKELKRSAKLAFIDELTELPNKRQFKRHLTQELSRASRHSQGVCVMYFDLDRFKELNDCYGQEIGNKTIIEFSNRLQQAFRTEEFVARLGGDEFASIVTNIANFDDVVKVADRLLEIMGQPFIFGDTKLYTSVSIGASIIRNGEHDENEAMRQADYALLQAKSEGRNCLKIFDPEMAKIITDRLTLEVDMRQAILEGGFHVEYQPLLSRKDHKIVGAEALLRWLHPTRGLISPEIFIPIAEKTGLILQLGEFVLNKACKDFADMGSKKLAVNVSPNQFQNDGFVHSLRSVLKKTGFDPKRLEIEITEGVFISDPKNAVKIITEIRAMGIDVALDDFGTGYSSMSYLQDFKLDRIKIDRSFVSKMDESDDSEKLISAMISMAETLKLDVTVEGVETLRQLEKLENYNCTEFQGFLFSKSVAITDFQKLCEDENTKELELIKGSDTPRLKLVAT